MAGNAFRNIPVNQGPDREAADRIAGREDAEMRRLSMGVLASLGVPAERLNAPLGSPLALPDNTVLAARGRLRFSVPPTAANALGVGGTPGRTLDAEWVRNLRGTPPNETPIDTSIIDPATRRPVTAVQRTTITDPETGRAYMAQQGIGADGQLVGRPTIHAATLGADNHYIPDRTPLTGAALNAVPAALRTELTTRHNEINTTFGSRFHMPSADGQRRVIAQVRAPSASV